METTIYNPTDEMLKQQGYKMGGFCAYITSDVLSGSGLSSSAAFETLIGTVVSGLYNHAEIPAVTIAQTGRYAENVYFGKPSGLMDQMACAIGGMVYIDFENEEKPQVEKIDVDFEKAGLTLCIVDTKGSHAGLTHELCTDSRRNEADCSTFWKKCTA